MYVCVSVCIVQCASVYVCTVHVCVCIVHCASVYVCVCLYSVQVRMCVCDPHMTHLELHFQDFLGNANVQHLHHAQHLLEVQRAIAVLVSFVKQIPQPPSIQSSVQSS